MRSIFCQLPSCNLFTQHVSYLLWRDTSNELWTPVHSFTLIIQPTANTVPFHALQFNTVFHTIRLILCFQQAGEIDNLTVSLGQSIVIVLCSGPRQRRNPWCCATSYFTVDNLLKSCCSYWFDKPWFHTEGKLAARLHQTFLLGSPNEQVRLASSLFLAPLPGSSSSSARGVSHFQSLYFVFVLLSLF